ncbi:MAG: ABC transporter ATP-binding protein [Candidatus Omnitrophica bacterium]|nr:ABC transporter ATP-binding protein [Candidatus Omnitrophota bacterium]
MSNLLEIRGLKVNFNLENQVVTAVRGVDLDIREDEVLVLAGESGSGKSVTALSVTRLLPKTAEIVSGSVNFHWVDLAKLDEKALVSIRGKEIAYIFQEPTSYLNPVYTIGSQLSEAIMLHHDKTRLEAFKEAVELLDLVKIKEPKRVIDDYPHQLSGGMNQRVFIAMALACRPRLLIADEPTTSLDVTVEAQILQLLMELKKSLGFSLLFITHNLSIARRIADRVSVMYKGKVVEEGDVEKIFGSPEHNHTKELIRAYEKIGKI